MSTDAVKVYGADWCHDTASTRNHLDSLGVPYRYINIDNDSGGKRWVEQQNAGAIKLPTVDINGKILSIPNEQQLELSLRGTGLMG